MLRDLYCKDYLTKWDTLCQQERNANAKKSKLERWDKDDLDTSIKSVKEVLQTQGKWLAAIYDFGV